MGESERCHLETVPKGEFRNGFYLSIENPSELRRAMKIGHKTILDVQRT